MSYIVAQPFERRHNAMLRVMEEMCGQHFILDRGE
jgi:hypothetical protein